MKTTGPLQVQWREEKLHLSRPSASLPCSAIERYVIIRVSQFHLSENIHGGGRRPGAAAPLSWPLPRPFGPCHRALGLPRRVGLRPAPFDLGLPDPMACAPSLRAAAPTLDHGRPGPCERPLRVTIAGARRRGSDVAECRTVERNASLTRCGRFSESYQGGGVTQY